jgi:PAS domain-containing protein
MAQISADLELNGTAFTARLRDGGGSMLIAQPVTREAEAELSLLRQPHPPSLLDGLPIGVYACEADGRVRWFNKAAAALWGPSLGEQAERFCGSLKLYDLDGTHIDPAHCRAVFQ